MNTFYDYMPYMATGGNFQQAPAQQQASDQNQKIMQYIQAYAQMSKTDPQALMQQLQKMEPAEQKKALAQIITAVNSAIQHQQGQQMQQQGAQQEAPEEQEYAYGGSPRKSKKGSTFSANLWYGQGGYIPSYAEYAYGGYHSEIPRLFNQEVDRPEKAMYGMGMAKGGQMPQWLAERRFAAAGNEDMMSQYGYAMGGPGPDNGPGDMFGQPDTRNNFIERIPAPTRSNTRKSKSNFSPSDYGFSNMFNTTLPAKIQVPMPTPSKKYHDVDPGMDIMPSGIPHGYNPDPRMSVYPSNVPHNYNPDPGFVVGPNFKKGGIYIKPSKRGTFTAAASKHGKSVQAFASQVLANKGNYSPAMVKKANFARNAAKWHHEEGGIVVGQEMEATPEMIQKLKDGGYTFEFVD
jgi:hypothetical protein